MKSTKRFRRLANGAAAFLLLVTALIQAAPGVASAYGQITERAIKLSSSALAATATSYEVSFKPATSTTVKSIAVDFCQNTPILGDSCTGTVGINTPTISSATVTTTGGVNNFSALTWTVTNTVNASRTFTIANATGQALTAGTTYTFTINNVTNPTDNDTGTAGNQAGTFYARLLTFPNDATSNFAGGYTGTNLATNIPTDAGGIALSTASQITVTSKVQERLTFCVYTGANCAAGGNAVSLGDTNGVLDPSGPFVDKNTKYDVATNASNDVAIRVKGGTLTSGSNTITAIGGTEASSSSGSEQFGFCTYESTSAGLVADAPYAGGSGSCSGTTQTAGTGTTGGNGTAQFAFNTTNTTSTYGEQFAHKPAGNSSTGVIAFLGNVSNTTEAGIYTTTLTFIATGTY